MRYRRVGPVALATALVLLPGATWGQMGLDMGRGMGMQTGRRGEPASRQPAPPSGRQAGAGEVEVTQAQMAGGMGHRATPFYLEPLFLLLVAAAGASGGVVTYRMTRGRWRRGNAPATFVTEAVLVVDLVQSTHLATHYGDGLAMKARTVLRDRTLALAKAHGLVFAESTGDGYFMTFGAVGSAIRTALALLAELRERPPDLAPAPPLSVRAGIAYGEILLDGRGARHGAVINKAFRLEGLRREAFVRVEEDAMGPEIPEDNRIFLGEDAAQEARSGGFAVEPTGFARLKGFTGLHRVYQIRDRA
jgi:class 3 adenylate cyclase